MKKIFATSVFLLSLCLSGQINTDFAGSFTFEYVSTNNDGTLTYNVDFSYSNDTSWGGGGTTSFGYYRKNSQSAPFDQLSMTAVSYTANPISSPCGANQFRSTIYRQTLDLDPNSQYEFVHSWCCRSPLVGNLDSAELKRQYIRAILITGKPDVRAYNNSPDFTETYFGAPAGTIVPVKICDNDPDGDSLSFVLTPNHGGTASASSFSMNNIGYDTANGFSFAYPLGSGSILSIDSASNTIFVKGLIPTVCLLNVRVKEWAKDTNNVYKIMGVHDREMAIDFTDPGAWLPYDLTLDTAYAEIFNDTIFMQSTGAVYFKNNFNDSGQAVVTNPLGDTATINSLGYTNGYTDIYLEIDSLNLSGLWKAYFNDIGSNSITGDCGNLLVDSIEFYVVPPPIRLFGDTGSVAVGQISTYSIVNSEHYDSLTLNIINGNILGSSSDSVSVEWGTVSNGYGKLQIEAVKVINNNFIGTLSKDSVETTIQGFTLNELANKLNIYPNPASSVIIADELPNHSKYEIVNISGQLIQGGLIENNSIQVNDLVPGTYILKIKSNDENWLVNRILISR